MSSPNTHTQATIATVASSVTDQTLLVANPARKRMIINNTGTGNLYIKFGTVASTTSFTYKITPGSLYQSNLPSEFVGQIDGIWDTANGLAVITEVMQ